MKLHVRTNATCLSDNELIILDALFDRGATFGHLRRESPEWQWSFGDTHSLDDDELQKCIESLRRQNLIEANRVESWTCFNITAKGGNLWEEERRPNWDRYCTLRYRTTSTGRTLESVVAVCPEIRDDFIRWWPLYPARHRRAVIADYGLIGWRTFSQLHVGIVTYQKEREWTPDQYSRYEERCRDHQAVLRRERTWWRDVPELQRFVPSVA
jgi:hypothetical protein